MSRAGPGDKAATAIDGRLGSWADIGRTSGRRARQRRRTWCILGEDVVHRFRHPELAQTTDNVEPRIAARAAVMVPRGPAPERKGDQRPQAPKRECQGRVIPSSLQPVAEIGLQDLLEPRREPAQLRQQLHHLVFVATPGHLFTHAPREEVQQLQPPADPVNIALGLNELQHAAHRVEEFARAIAVRKPRRGDRRIEDRVRVVYVAPDDFDYLHAPLTDHLKSSKAGPHPGLVPPVKTLQNDSGSKLCRWRSGAANCSHPIQISRSCAHHGPRASREPSPGIVPGHAPRGDRSHRPHLGCAERRNR